MNWIMNKIRECIVIDFFFLNETKIIFSSTENSTMKFVCTKRLKQINKSEAEG